MYNETGRCIRKRKPRSGRAGARAVACDIECELTIDEHAEALGVSKSTLNRAIAWDKKREKHKHLINTDQQEAVLSALDKRHSILMAQMERLSKAEHTGAGNELAALNSAILKVEGAQADVLEHRAFSLGEQMCTPEGVLFREGEGYPMERWQDITGDMPASEEERRVQINRQPVDFLAGLIAEAPELVDYLTDEKKGEVKEYCKKHLSIDQGNEVVKTA